MNLLQKYILFFVAVICDRLTRRDKSLIHAKYPVLSLHESYMYSKLTCLFRSVSHNEKIFLLFNAVDIDGTVIEIFKSFNSS